MGYHRGLYRRWLVAPCFKTGNWDWENKSTDITNGMAYFHKTYEKDSNLSSFLLIAPNTIVLDRLKDLLIICKFLILIQ